MSSNVNICVGSRGRPCCAGAGTEISRLTWFLCVDPTFSLSPHLNLAAGRTGDSLEHRRRDWWFGETAVLLFFMIITHQVNRVEESTILV